MDHFSLVKVLSAILIFCGVYLVTRSKARAEVEIGIISDDVGKVKIEASKNSLP
jgi:hypothetical protein